MKTMTLVLTLAVVLPFVAYSAPNCVSGSLTSYFALDGTGCMIGSTVFSDFTLLDTASNAVSIDPATVQVNPIGSASEPGFRFDVNTQAGPDITREVFFSYLVSSSSTTGNTASMTGSQVTEDGAVTVIEQKCFGAAYIGTVCPTTENLLILFDIGIAADTSEHLDFPSTPQLGVALDVLVGGGASGSAALGSVTNLFNTAAATQIPEPGTVALVGVGFGLLSYRRLRRNR